jgi:hypothetical protein
MKPRVEYFKFTEAMSRSGQWELSEEARNEKMRALMALIEEYELVGISASVPENVYLGWFGAAPHPYGNPYFMLFYGVISRLVRYAASINYEHKIDFVFDTQIEQMDKVLGAWGEFERTTPPKFKHLIGDPPIFRSDKWTLPLQAADFIAGWTRTMNTAVELRRPIPEPPWSPRGNNVQREYNFMEWWHAADIYNLIFGIRPITFTFGGSGTEFSGPPKLHLPSWPTSWAK